VYSRCTCLWFGGPTWDRKTGWARSWQPVSIEYSPWHTEQGRNQFCLCKLKGPRMCRSPGCRSRSCPFDGSLHRTRVGMCRHNFQHLLGICTALFTSIEPFNWLGWRFHSLWSWCWFGCTTSTPCRSCSKCKLHRDIRSNQDCWKQSYSMQPPSKPSIATLSWCDRWVALGLPPLSGTTVAGRSTFCRG
jgi:hypothetical protein